VASAPTKAAFVVDQSSGVVTTAVSLN